MMMTIQVREILHQKIMEIKKNQIFEGECIDYTYDGLGVVKYDTFCLFVKDMAIGDIGEIVVTALKKDYGYGKLLKLIKPSEYRAEPVCPYSRICGGCQLQHLSVEGQKAFKENIVRNDIRKIGGLDNEINPIISMDDPYGYRNKIIFPVSTDKNGKCIIGFYRYNSHDIIEVKNCFLQSERVNRLLNKLKELIDRYSLAEEIRNIMIRDMSKTDSIMLVLVTRSEKADLGSLVREVVQYQPSIKSVIQNINPDKTNVVLGKKEKLLYGDEYIIDELCGMKFIISSHSFYQVNTRQTSVLYNKALQLAQLSKDDTLLDLYCGVGTIGITASQYVKSVTGVEIVESAIENAKENCRINNITNVDFICGDAEVISKKFREENRCFDVTVIDPPRKGCSNETVKTLIELNSRKIIYISCNPSTLARDLKLLSEYYDVETVQPVDMFPQTYHVESIALLVRK